MSLLSRIAIGLATGLGLGYSPFASGTVGSVWGVLIAWGIDRALNGQPRSALWQLAVAVVLALIAMPICDRAEKVFKKKDDGRIVADEYLTFPITMIGLPFTPWVVASAFVINRVLDIVKPWPARQLQSVKGGPGIVLDDVFAAAYACIVMHLGLMLKMRLGL